jgi:hypothetical protein
MSRLALSIFSAALVLLAFCTFSGLALFLFSRSQNSTQPLQIFLDENLHVPYNGLFWSNVYAGVNNQTIWLKNSGPAPLENLSLIVPLLPGNIMLTWDSENYTLKPYELKKATLLLTVPSSDAKRYDQLWMRFYVVYYTEVI